MSGCRRSLIEAASRCMFTAITAGEFHMCFFSLHSSFIPSTYLGRRSARDILVPFQSRDGWIYPQNAFILFQRNPQRTLLIQCQIVSFKCQKIYSLRLPRYIGAEHLCQDPSAQKSNLLQNRQAFLPNLAENMLSSSTERETKTNTANQPRKREAGDDDTGLTSDRSGIYTAAASLIASIDEHMLIGLLELGVEVGRGGSCGPSHSLKSL